LAVGIIALAKAERAEQTNRTAINRTHELLATAKEEHTDAVAAVERARDADAQAVAKGKPSPGLMGKARAEEQRAADQVQVAKLALDKLAVQMPGLETAERLAREQVERLADAVIASEAPLKRLVKECVALTEQLIHKRLTLRLVSDLVAREEERECIADALAVDQPPAPGGVQYRDWSEHPVEQQWQRAREELMRDADALLEF
jgi:hypothetical protein